MKRAILLLALVSCIADAAPPPVVAPLECRPGDWYAFYPPVGFDDAAYAEIRRAAEAWNSITFPDHRITFSELGHQRILNYKPSVPTYVAEHVGDAGVILVSPGEPDVYRVMLHEFGHHLWLSHIGTRVTVMCGDDVAEPNCGDVQATGITETDVAECRRVGSCP